MRWTVEVMNSLMELEEERERQTALLEEFYIYSNPAYIYLKGDARICVEDGRELRIYHDLPMSIPFETFQKAESIHIRDAALMTVENLTSFHRLEREHIFYLFLEWLPYPHETGAFAADRQRKSGTFLVSFWRSRSRRSGDRGTSDPKDGTAVSAVRDGRAGIAAVSDICEAIGSTRSDEGGSDDKTGQQLCRMGVYCGICGAGSYKRNRKLERDYKLAGVLSQWRAFCKKNLFWFNPDFYI